ncbi:MAG: hypothetical protein IPJ19_12650 [Planctomycetes bacterium]|nr:hypothetical protein [Planctomycetota bacterium]
MKSFLVSIVRGLAFCCSALFDLAYGGVLALLRGLHLFWNARSTRLLLRYGWRTLRVGFLVALLVCAALGAGWLFFERVPAGYVGVRQRNFLGAGLDAQDHPAGLVFCVRGLHTLHVVETRTQLVSFAWDTEGGRAKALDVRTSDGNTVNVSVAVPYRVRPGEAHLLVADGLKLAYPLRVQSATEKVLLEEFGALDSDQMMHTDLRDERVQHALERLRPILEVLHVVPEAVLVTQVLFKGDYEKKLQEKQLTLQEAELHRTAAEVEVAKKKTELYEQQTDALVKGVLSSTGTAASRSATPRDSARSSRCRPNRASTTRRAAPRPTPMPSADSRRASASSHRPRRPRRSSPTRSTAARAGA